VQEVARLHRGTIRLQNLQPTGAKAILTLPL
jgi:two-component system sensor histidine kinase CreC